jgi:asparagine synthase (glutamine-hydrolysing)
MSGFFGIFRPQGGPVDLEAFEQMKTAMHREGFDGMETHVEDKIAMGHLMLRVSPESKYDKQPLKSSCGNYLLVGHFRLDYRDELGDKLGLTQAELELTPDSQLAMLAYQKWKEKCVHHLEGDWALAVFSRHTETLFICKDWCGCSALFFFQKNEALFFSTNIDVITEVKYLNHKVDILQFSRLSTQGLWQTKGHTLMKNVFYLDSSYGIIFDKKMNLTKVYFSQIDNNSSFKYKFEIDYWGHLFSVFSNAVHSRIRDSVQKGILLSSGFDSTAVSYFLSKLFEKKFPSVIYSFTSFPAYLDKLSFTARDLSNEVPHVQDYLINNKSIEPSYFSFLEVSLSKSFTPLKNGNCYDPLVNPNTIWVEGLLLDAKAKSVRKIFTGQFGNYSISWRGHYPIINKMLNLQFFSAHEDLYLLARSEGLSYATVVKKYIIKQFFIRLKIFLKKIFICFNDQRFNNPMFQNSGYTIKLAISEIAKKSFVLGITDFLSPRKQKLSLIENFGVKLGMDWYNYGMSYSIEILDPTADLRVNKYLLSIPESMFFKNGVAAFLYKKMMEPFLSHDWLYSGKQRLQSIDIGYRIENDHSIKEIINQIAENNFSNNKLDVSDIINCYELLKKEKNINNKYLLGKKLLFQISLYFFVEKHKNSFF